MRDEQGRSPWKLNVEIFLVSGLILFLELALIRWVSSEIGVFGRLSNVILVICFFGTGLGCYLSARPVQITRFGLNFLLVSVLVANPFHSSRLDLHNLTVLLGGFDYLSFWTQSTGLTMLDIFSGLAIFAVVVYLLAWIFVPLGQILSGALTSHPRVINAYSVNILGSLAGIWLFHGLSFLLLPPSIWFGAATILFVSLVALRHSGWWALPALVLAIVAIFHTEKAGQLTVWSRYHKLSLMPAFAEDAKERIWQGYELYTGAGNYQQMLDLSHEFVTAHPTVFDTNSIRFSCYELPLRFKPKIGRMLIVGAGAGNNAAGALRLGAEQVDCVEIDAQIYELGRRFHPEHPYDSPRVHTVVGDARAFFKQARGLYDVIWFGWLDSHMLVSAYNSMRLDHYVYTRESFIEAKRLLADDGLIVVTMGAPLGSTTNWIGDRIFGLLKDVFGNDPLAYVEGKLPPWYGARSGATFVCGNKPVTTEMLENSADRSFVETNLASFRGTTKPTTDDWPYLYLQFPKVPRLHVVTSLLIGIAAAVQGQKTLRLGTRTDWHFFALGVAFLLLEVQTVSRATLLFGMTWMVNAIVISALLAMILLANLVAARWPKVPHWFIVAGLATTIVALALVPLNWFNALIGVEKLVAASVFLTAPVFFAGLIFIRSFAVCADKSRALGSNLIGALVGGLLESLSFVTGIQALVLLVGLFYVLAIWFRPSIPSGREV